MSDRPRPATVAVVLAAGGALGCAGVALLLAARLDGAAGVTPSLELLGAVGAAALAVLGATLVLRSEVVRVGWLLVAAGGALALLNATYNATIAHTLGVLDLGMFFLPVAWVQHWIYPLPDVLALGVLPLLLPDGSVASRRWRAWLWAVAGLTVTVCGLLAVADGPLGDAFDGPLAGPGPANPVGLVPMATVEGIGTVLVVVLALVVPIVSAVALVSRVRTADALQRRQLGWIGLGLLAALVLALTEQTVGWLAPGLNDAWPVSQVTGLLALGAMVAALAAALLRYRLWDVDLVANRTAVGLVMTAGIVAVYVAGVAVLGGLTARDGGLLPGVVGAGLVAAVAHPLRLRVQRLVNRIMFGDRDDPYEVLSVLGRTLSQAPDGRSATQQLADTVAAALRAPYVAVELDGVVVSATGQARSADAFPLHHQGQAVGQLLVAPRTSYEPLSPRDRHLLRQIADQAGPAVHATQLVRAARAARARLAGVREEERQRLRRDLHDGIGPTLAGHSLMLERAIDLVAAPDAAAAEVLTALHEQTRSLVGDIRSLVHELRPPALDELGLIGALHALTDPYRSHLQLDLRTPGAPPTELPAAVEVAVYRIVAEAVTNVVRHAHATRCDVVIEVGPGSVRVQVADDGRGRCGAAVGTGTTTMTERAAELGGRLQISDRERGGTTVDAEIPIVVSP